MKAMCQGSETENINGNINLDAEIKMMGDNNNNNNFFTNFSGVSPHCSCMNGSRRVRKRHPATVQTPGRAQEMVEGEVMEPLVSYLDRLEPARWGSGSGPRDFNDNLRCDDGSKGFETQFVMEFSHLKMTSSQRHGSYDDCASQDLNKCQLLSSSRKLK